MRDSTHRMRRAAVVAAIMLAGAGFWWLMRAPALERTVVASTPEPDIEPAAARKRRQAAFALAMAPDRPWIFAEAVAASAASAPAIVSRCGLDGRPAPEEGASGAEPGHPAKPASPGWLAELARLDAAMQASGDPFDRAVAAWLDLGERRTPAERLDAIALSAETTSDARVYALAYRACREGNWSQNAALATAAPGTACEQLSARRWSELDPTNAVPWLYVFSQAVAADDPTAQNEALARMAAAERFEDGLHLASGAVAAHASKDDEGLAADLDASERAFQKSVGQNEPFSALMDACRHGAGGDANRAQQCQAIGESMFNHGDNLLLHALGASVVFQATGDASRRDQARAERVAMSRAWSPGTGLSECGVVRDGLRAMQRSAQVGELAAARERLREGVPP